MLKEDIPAKPPINILLIDLHHDDPDLDGGEPGVRDDTVDPSEGRILRVAQGLPGWGLGKHRLHSLAALV